MFSLTQTGLLRLIHITDTHLNAPEDGHLLGMKTLHSLHCVLDIVREQQPDFDAFLVTGDLSQDGSAQSYQHLKDALAPFQRPTFWLAGNHDHPITMHEAMHNTEHGERIVRSSHWQIVLLNSQQPGKVYGELADSELLFLEQCLLERPDLHTLVTFHHHPIDMGSRWIDNIGLKNRSRLFDVLQQHPHVKAVLWGHVHQHSDRMVDGIRMISTPSTCVQFKPESDDFTIDTLAPAYRWLELHDNGDIRTGVQRVENIEFTIDFSVKGY
ncbi:MAG: 3',5'-cyclic-AMP phosphodiesterase [Bacterioplanes sp.]|nr:3',5'-cyclic-AMP phosphodiesterase [Bacterioplanes sp.]